MRGTLEVDRQIAGYHEYSCGGPDIRLRAQAATTGQNLDDILRECLGKTGQRTTDDPRPRLFPMRQNAGDDVAHHRLRNDRVGSGENGLAGEKLRLRRQSAHRTEILAVSHVCSLIMLTTV
ncbi:hypothetical protein D3C80_1484450 [compost metagenome]